MLDKLAGFMLVIDFAVKADSKQSIFILNFFQKVVSLDVLESAVDHYVFDHKESLLLACTLFQKEGVPGKILGRSVFILKIEPLVLCHLARVQLVFPKRTQLRHRQVLCYFLRSRHDSCL